MSLRLCTSSQSSLHRRLVKCLDERDNNKFQELYSVLKNKDLVGSDGMTLLHHTVTFNNADIARYLVAEGADVNALNNAGLTALSVAIKFRRASVIKALLSANASIYGYNGCLHSPLQAALSADTRLDADVVMRFLQILRRDKNSDSVAIAEALLDAKCPLPRAVLLRDAAITRHMLERGSSIDETDYDEDTALHYAVRASDVDQVELLCEWEADVVFSVNSRMKTPLHLYDVHSDDNHQILRALLEHGSPLTDRDHDGYMAVTKIFAFCKKETIRILFKHGVDLHATNRNGTTLLHHAACNENVGVIEQFRGRDFDIEALDRQQHSALLFAAQLANVSAVEFLLDNGSNTSIVDLYGRTPFMKAVALWILPQEETAVHQSKVLKCIEVFLRHKIQIDVVDSEDKTPFQYLLEPKHFVFSKPLLEYVQLGRAFGQYTVSNLFFLMELETSEKFNNYLEFCRLKMVKLMRTGLCGQVSLFNFLIEDPRQLEVYARNNRLAEKAKTLIYGLRRSKIYFIKVLRRNVLKALWSVTLRKKAAKVFRKVEILQKDQYVIEHIMAYLQEDDLLSIWLTSYDRVVFDE